MRKAYIGIDLAAKCCWGATVDKRGEPLSLEKFKTSEGGLIAYVRKQKGERTVLLEECDLAGWAQRVLMPYAGKVVVCDPKFNLWVHRDTVKNDKIDAKKLAQIAMLGSYKEVYHTTDERVYLLHLAVKDYGRLARRTTGLKNQIKARLGAQGVICEGARIFGKKGRQQALSLIPNPLLREIAASDYETLDFLLRKQAQAKGRFVRLGKMIPVVQAWQDIPGVGPAGAAKFCAYVKCPHRFADKGDLFKYSCLGVTSSVTGGKQVGRQHLDRSGCAALKDVAGKAFHAALHTRGDNLLKRSYQRALASTGSEVHARLTTERKVLVIMWTMWKHGTAYDDDHDRKNGACEARL